MKAFVEFFVDAQDSIVTEALFVPLDDGQKAEQTTQLAAVLAS